MFYCEKWPLLRPPLLYARFLKVAVNRLLGRVRRAGNEKLLGSNLWIYHDRASYKSVVPRSKDGGCTSARRSDAGDLVRRVFVDLPASRIAQAF
jgi:hypothetical protein